MPTIQSDNLFLVLYEKEYKHEGKDYKVKEWLVGFFNTKAGEENDPYFIGSVFGKLTGRDLPFCDMVELDRWEFKETCKVVKKITRII